MAYLFYRIKSPTDIKIIRDQKLLAKEKQHINNLEYTIANKKLTNDLLSEANLVKDELHIMEGIGNLHCTISQTHIVNRREKHL